MVLDLLAGGKQWRNPANGRNLSIALHFCIGTLIIALVTFEFLQAQPTSFVAWFKAESYWFITALALVRLCAGAALLVRDKDLH